MYRLVRDRQRQLGADIGALGVEFLQQPMLIGQVEVAMNHQLIEQHMIAIGQRRRNIFDRRATPVEHPNAGDQASQQYDEVCPQQSLPSR